MALGLLRNPFRRRAAPPAPAAPAARGELSAEPIAATSVGRCLPGTRQRASLELMHQLRLNVPVMRQAISILSGFAGVPRLIGDDDAHTADLQEGWATNVRAGWSGDGLAAFLQDHIAQALWYGYGIAEAEVAPTRDEVSRLWSYRSPNFRFEYLAGPPPSMVVRQRNAPSGRPPLDPARTCVSTFEPEGSDPHGQPLFLACPTIAQAVTTAVFAHKALWQRAGIPLYHVNVKMPPQFSDDHDFTLTKKLAAIYQSALNAAVKSQMELGQAKDFVSIGDVEINMIGLEGMAMDFQISKRALLEEIVVATGIPPSLFGYSWSSTERMSSVQSRKLAGVVWAIRRCVEPCVRHLVDLRQQLRGEARAYKLEWPDASLTDLLETSQAALNDARAKHEELRYWFDLWRAGITDQLGAAEALTGQPAVKRPMEEPPALAPAGGGGFGGGADGGAGAEGEMPVLAGASNGNGWVSPLAHVEGGW